MMHDQYHNFSFWDPVWKFNSYGAKEVITRLGNGALFDFGRLPIFTGLIIIGLFVIDYFPFTLLFFFFLFFYFGRTTWGNIINIIPSMREFHLSRFIVGVHAAGFFLAPIGLTWLVTRVTDVVSRVIKSAPSRKSIHTHMIRFLMIFIAFVAIVALVYPQTIKYAEYNDTLITQANNNYAKQSTDANALVSTLQNLEKTAPGRVFTGRGGSWGRDFRISETPMYMYLSNFGIPIVLWLPETWSPNADTEQYFREDHAEDYDLYDIRYVTTPANLAKENIQPFWKLIKQNPSWKLYEVQTSGYFTTGVQPAIAASDKYSYTNLIRLWIQSSDPKNGLYPQLTFDTKTYPVNTGLPNFKMTDEATYVTPDSQTHSLFAEPPRYETDLSQLENMNITNQTENTDMIFSAKVSVPSGCDGCMVILKQSYHPNWKVTVDGKPVTPIIVFPFFIGIPVTKGTHTIICSYTPSSFKVFLLWTDLVILIGILVWLMRRKLGIDRRTQNAAN